jgi:DNA gyrase subunit A
MQLSRLAALEHQKITNEHDALKEKITDFKDIIANVDRQNEIVLSELDEIAAKYSDARRTEIIPVEGEVCIEDLIKEEEVVITVTQGGYVKRTLLDNYKVQHRGGKGIRGAQIKDDDALEHFFVTTTHNWILFFTNLGRVYRIKGYEIADAGRVAKGQHIANLLQLMPDEKIAKVMDLSDYNQADYLLFATKRGIVKKTPLLQYDSQRVNGLKAINLRVDENGVSDELVGVLLANEDSGVILVSKKGMAVKFKAEILRAQGRATSGVTGMRFRGDDELLSINATKKDLFLVTVTEKGYAKRSHIDEYNFRGRGGLGVKVANITEERGLLVGAVVVEEEDELMAIMESAKIIRSNVSEIRQMSRNSMGVRFVKPDEGDRIIAVAKNEERTLNSSDEDGGEADEGSEGDVNVTEGAISADSAESNAGVTAEVATEVADDAGDAEGADTAENADDNTVEED